jgi:hypothetical protein
MDTPEHDSRQDLSEVEKRLAAWRSAPAALDRDRLLYEAGRAAARSESRSRLSLSAAACLGVATLVLGGQYVRERERGDTLERRLASLTAPPVVPSPAISQPASLAPVADSYWTLSRNMPALLFEDTRSSSAPTPGGRLSAPAAVPLTPLGTQSTSDLLHL